MVNQFQQNEKIDTNLHSEDKTRHSAELLRQACTDGRVNTIDYASPGACGDMLPACGFEPLSPKEQRQAYVREIAAPLFAKAIERMMNAEQ